MRSVSVPPVRVLTADLCPQDPISPANGDVTSPRENGSGDSRIKRENRPASRSGSSSNSSTPVSKPSKDHLVSHTLFPLLLFPDSVPVSIHPQNEKPPTPVSKSITPTSSGSATPSAGANKPPKATTSIGLPYPYLHAPPGPGHPGLPAELASAAYSQGLLHNSSAIGYPRGIVSRRICFPATTDQLSVGTGWL